MIRFMKASISDAKLLVETQIKAFSVDVDICGEGPPGYDSVERQIELIENNIYYKIMDNNSIVGGFFIFTKAKGHYEIVRLFIEPSCQGKGIGSLALRFIEGLFDDLEILELEASDFRPDNHAFYENRGYIRVGKVEYGKDSFSYKYRRIFSR